MAEDTPKTVVGAATVVSGSLTTATGMTTLTVTISGEVLQALEDIQRRTGLSTTEILRDALTLEKLYTDAKSRGDTLLIGSGSTARPITLKREP